MALNNSKFRLNIYQAGSLLMVCLGILLQLLSDNQLGVIISLLGIINFSFFTKMGKGIAIALLIILLGIINKTMHWPGSGIIFLAGILMAGIFGYLNFVVRIYYTDRLLIWLSLLIAFSGFYLKIMHYPFASELIIIGFTMLSASYFYRFLLKKPKDFEDYNKLAVVVFYSITAVLASLRLDYSTISGFLFVAVLLSWVGFSVNREISEYKSGLKENPGKRTAFKELENIPQIIAGDQCYLKEIFHPERDHCDIDYSLAYAYVKPGGKTLSHYLLESKNYYILAGTGLIHVGEETFEVKAGFSCIVPPKTSQWIENNSDGRLEFLVIVNPAWQADHEFVK